MSENNAPSQAYTDFKRQALDFQLMKCYMKYEIQNHRQKGTEQPKQISLASVVESENPEASNKINCFTFQDQ